MCFGDSLPTRKSLPAFMVAIIQIECFGRVPTSAVKPEQVWKCWLVLDTGVMVAWAGIEHLRLGIYEEPPPVDEPDDIRVRGVYVLSLSLPLIVAFYYAPSRVNRHHVVGCMLNWMTTKKPKTKNKNQKKLNDKARSLNLLFVWTFSFSSKMDSLICGLAGNLERFLLKEWVEHVLWRRQETIRHWRLKWRRFLAKGGEITVVSSYHITNVTSEALRYDYFVLQSQEEMYSPIRKMGIRVERHFQDRYSEICRPRDWGSKLRRIQVYGFWITQKLRKGSTPFDCVDSPLY